MLKAYLVGGSQDTQGQPAQLLAKVEVTLQNGITMFQYREKGPGALTGGARIQLGHRLRALCRQYDCPFVVDDDLALASELGADGIHVGQRDQGIEAVLAAAQAAGLFVGYSCATAAQLARANQLAGVGRQWASLSDDFEGGCRSGSRDCGASGVGSSKSPPGRSDRGT